MELAGKWALVTGSGRRLGREIALALARAGANVAVHYHRSAAEAEKTAADIQALGRQAQALRADLARPGEIEAMFAALSKQPGRLDVLVNSAAVFHRTPIETLSAEQWDAENAVNARAPALCIRHALPLMRGRGGVIVNVADVSAEQPWAGYPAYCASKAALLALTRSAAKALAGDGIRVNAVSPGAVLWPEDASEDHRREVLAQVPLKRTGSPADVGEAVVFLCRCEYVTGEDLRVDGGWHLR